MRSTYKIYALALFSAFLVLGSGCKKYLDVNQNPNDATPNSVTLSMVLSAAERNISNNFALGSGLGTTMTDMVPANQAGMVCTTQSPI